MRSQLQTFIFVDIGSAVSKSFAFNFDSSQVKLVKKAESPTLSGVDWIKPNLIEPVSKGISQSRLLISVSPEADNVNVPKLENTEVLDEEVLWRKIASACLLDKETLFLEIGAGKSWRMVLGKNQLKEITKFDLGLGKGAPRLVRKLTSETQLSRWIPRQVPFEEISDYVGNKKIYPSQIPLGKFALEVEQALAREILRRLVAGVEQINASFKRVILAGEVFRKSPQLGQIMLSFLEGVEPRGVVEVEMDGHGVAPFFSYREWRMDSWLTKLGSVISFTHSLSGGAPLGRVFIDLGLREEVAVIVRSGDLVRIPLEKDQVCTLRLELATGVEVDNFSPKAAIKGGVLGLILDARGRPLPQLKSDAVSRELLQTWQEALI